MIRELVDWVAFLFVCVVFVFAILLIGGTFS